MASAIKLAMKVLWFEIHLLPMFGPRGLLKQPTDLYDCARDKKKNPLFSY
jgi:hypothetical protein